uniref:C2H2-type domain-containing protein n=1 Tax=Plectus sambesii TaxID=2011161 RepID=A0A914UQH6_9BILA
MENDECEERSPSRDGTCLLCGDPCDDIKVHLRVAHQSEVAVAAIFPSDDEKSRWIQSFIMDGNGFTKTASRTVKFEETPSSSPSDETAGSSGIITNAIKVEEDVDQLEKNGIDDLEADGSPAAESSGRLTCQMCGEQLRAQEARRHIFKEHLDVEDLFRCSACNFKSSCSQQVVRSHAQRTHGDKNAVVSRLPEYKERISALELRCFPSKGRRTENEWVTCAICEQ